MPDQSFAPQAFRADVSGPPRRGRVIAAVALTALVLVVVATLVLRVQDQREGGARQQAQLQEDAATLAGDLADLARAVEAPALGLAESGPNLADMLREHVVVSPRTDAVVDAAREVAEEDIRRLVGRLDTALAISLPEPVPGLDVDTQTAALEAAASLRAEASALRAEASAAVERGDRWGDAVRAVTAALDAHAVVAATSPESAAPDVVAASWEAERPSLLQLERVARAATDVPGLADWAEAHVTYAVGAQEWIDEAVALLEDDDVEAYNARLAEVVDADPFGLGSALTSILPGTVDGPVLEDLRAVGVRAGRVLELESRLLDAAAALRPAD